MPNSKLQKDATRRTGMSCWIRNHCVDWFEVIIEEIFPDEQRADILNRHASNMLLRICERVDRQCVLSISGVRCWNHHQLLPLMALDVKPRRICLQSSNERANSGSAALGENFVWRSSFSWWTHFRSPFGNFVNMELRKGSSAIWKIECSQHWFLQSRNEKRASKSGFYTNDAIVLDWRRNISERRFLHAN